MQISFVADDLDGIFVGRHGAVRTQAVEHGAKGFTHGIGTEGGVVSQREVGHIVVDADGEVAFAHACGQPGKHGRNHGRREFLGSQAIASAEHFRQAGETRRLARGVLGQRDQHVLEQRLAV